MSYREAMSLTMPQITLLGHASHISYERMKRRSDVVKKAEDVKAKYEDDNPVVWGSKRLDELNSDELMLYYSSGFGG